MTSKKEPQSAQITSPDLQAERLAELRRLMPDLFDGEGALDEKALRQLAAKEAEHVAEKFRFEWAGKAQSKRFAFTPSRATLTFDSTRSLNADGSANKADETLTENTSQNLIIEGDNLEVLKLLQTSYFEKVKCIYIDPPYNTGKDFIYPDNYSQSRQEYWERSGTTQNGVRLKAITETSGRRHSDWLSFMQSRLLLARNMLREDGVIFVSIDDNEVHNLRKVMDEVFGEENFIGNIVWESKTKSQNTKDSYNKLQPKVENILLYTKRSARRFNLIVIGQKKYPNEDIEGCYREHLLEYMNSSGMRGRDTMIFEIEGVFPPNGKQWQIGKETVDKYKKRNDIILKNGNIIIKIRPDDENVNINQPFWGLFNKEIGTGESGKAELKKLFNTDRHLFETVKPIDLIRRLIFHSTKNNDIILDFFAGTGTTAHAVMSLNTEDGGKRKHITVQIPETIESDEEAYKAGYKTISDITVERVKRAGANLREENPDWKGDTGFRVLKLASSHFPQNTFAPDPDKSENENIAALEAHLVDAAQRRLFEEDAFQNVVTEIALKNGFGLFYSLERAESYSKNAVYRIDGNNKSTLLCLENPLDMKTIEALKLESDTQLIVLKDALNTTKKFELQAAFKDNLWVV